MKITICGSVSSTPKIKEISDELKKLGHTTELPFTSKKILAGEIDLIEFVKEKEKNGDSIFRKQGEEAGVDMIKRYYNLIKDSDAIIVVNIDKNGIENYIGGNVFLEMGFAYALDKKIFLLNDIPNISYKDELMAMKPIILNNDLSKISASSR